MTQFLIRRIFWAIFLFFVATIITYLIFWVIPADPAALAAGKSATPADIARVSHFLHLDEPIWKQYLRFLWNLVGHGSLGQSFVNRQSVDSIIAQGRARHGLARVRRRHLLAHTFDPDRDPLGASSAFDHGSLLDDLRADRHLGSPGLDRPDPLLRLRLSAAPHPDRRLLQLHPGNDRGAMRRAGQLGLPPDLALDHVHDPVRRALRAPDPSERDGDDVRGLRADRARQGRVAEPRDGAARAAEQHASRS